MDAALTALAPLFEVAASEDGTLYYEFFASGAHDGGWGALFRHNQDGSVDEASAAVEGGGECARCHVLCFAPGRCR